MVLKDPQDYLPCIFLFAYTLNKDLSDISWLEKAGPVELALNDEYDCSDRNKIY